MRLAQYIVQQGLVGSALALLFASIGWCVGRPWDFRRSGTNTDLAFLFTQGAVNQAGLALSFALIAYFGIDTAAARRGSGSVGAWPLAIQIVSAFALWEFLVYWQHRLLHDRVLWPVHAVHHSSRTLDWLSTYRMHPIEVCLYLAPIPILLGLGFSTLTLAWISVFRIVHNSFVHADLPWRLGPLRFVLVSPVLHRWHHETAPEASGKNFASGLALYDVLFGTFYCPTDRLPGQFGIDDPVPGGFLGQLTFPLRHRTRGDTNAP